MMNKRGRLIKKGLSIIWLAVSEIKTQDIHIGYSEIYKTRNACYSS